MGFDFSMIRVLIGIAIGAVVGIVISGVLIASTQVAPWIVFLSFFLSTLIGWALGLIAAMHDS